HVGVARARVAGDALENRLALAVFRCDMPAGRASLRCVRSWNKFESLSSFVHQPGDQHSPALPPNLAVEAPFLRDVGAGVCTRAARRACHGTHIQILDADGVEAARHIGGGLFYPVTATIRFTSTQPGNSHPRSRPSSRST